MNVTQRGILPPAQFNELAADVQSSLLLPANVAALVAAGSVRALATLRHALLVYNGFAQTITRQVNVNSVNRSSAGVYTIDYTNAGFTADPYVFGMTRGAGTRVGWQSISTTQCVVNVSDMAGVLADEHLSFLVIGS